MSEDSEDFFKFMMQMMTATGESRTGPEFSECIVLFHINKEEATCQELNLKCT